MASIVTIECLKTINRNKNVLFFTHACKTLVCAAFSTISRLLPYSAEFLLFHFSVDLFNASNITSFIASISMLFKFPLLLRSVARWKANSQKKNKLSSRKAANPLRLSIILSHHMHRNWIGKSEAGRHWLWIRVQN